MIERGRVRLRELERLRRRRQGLALLSVACTIAGVGCLVLFASHTDNVALLIAGIVALLAAVYSIVVVVETGR